MKTIWADMDIKAVKTTPTTHHRTWSSLISNHFVHHALSAWENCLLIHFSVNSLNISSYPTLKWLIDYNCATRNKM